MAGRSQPPRLENGNWLCKACKNINYARRESCNRCHTSKPAGTFAHPHSLAHTHMQTHGQSIAQSLPHTHAHTQAQVHTQVHTQAYTIAQPLLVPQQPQQSQQLQQQSLSVHTHSVHSHLPSSVARISPHSADGILRPPMPLGQRVQQQGLISAQQGGSSRSSGGDFQAVSDPYSGADYHDDHGPLDLVDHMHQQRHLEDSGLSNQTPGGLGSLLNGQQTGQELHANAVAHGYGFANGNNGPMTYWHQTVPESTDQLTAMMEASLSLSSNQNTIPGGNAMVPGLLNTSQATAALAQYTNASAASVSGKGAPKAGVDGNWMCIDLSCRNVNYPRRKYCNRCGRQRTALQDDVADNYFRRLVAARQQKQSLWDFSSSVTGTSNMQPTSFESESSAGSLNPQQQHRALIWGMPSSDDTTTDQQLGNTLSPIVESTHSYFSSLFSGRNTEPSDNEWPPADNGYSFSFLNTNSSPFGSSGLLFQFQSQGSQDLSLGSHAYSSDSPHSDKEFENLWHCGDCQNDNHVGSTCNSCGNKRF
eukprot:TRINITY_DN2527_c0_g5_i1.p1 TRINITY_DN2527_c0_g5~~TRINITY_DN2527_c0_g5_i1.p1  ORF type:complete len:533 (-),score=78.99 TRINITY_DN2527_c0_g5_i1:1624-3222(-)